MFTKNRNLTLKVLATFTTVICFSLCTFIFESCSKNQKESDSNLNIPEEFKQVGELHNQGLDYAFKVMREKTIEYTHQANSGLKSALPIDYYALINEAILDFCKSKNYLNQNSNFCEYTISRYSQKLRIKTTDSTDVEVFTIEQQKLIDKISEAVNNKYSEENLNNLNAKLDEINQVAFESLSETDAAAIYSANSTAYSSYKYWLDNNIKWYVCIRYPELLEQYSDAELYQLIKNGTLELKSANSIDSWFGDIKAAIQKWWDEHGSLIVTEDLIGAGIGAVQGIYSATYNGLVFGPEGAVIAGTAGAISGAVVGGITASATGATATILQ